VRHSSAIVFGWKLFLFLKRNCIFSRSLQKKKAKGLNDYGATALQVMKKRIIQFIATFSLLITITGSTQDWAKAKLEKSPRHQEWVQIKQNSRTLECFVVYPEIKEKATAVVVIHENRGLTDWVRNVADQLAEAGYIAIAPDLLSGSGPNAGKTIDFANQDAATKAIYALPEDQVTSDLKAAADYMAKLSSANGKVAVVGFCWGGAQAFRFATNKRDLKTAFVFYGTGPEKADDVTRINRPVYGFMRSGEEPNAKEANAMAREAAWKRLRELLKKL
jgi:carboxymethylenebutenolidase